MYYNLVLVQTAFLICLGSGAAKAQNITVDVNNQPVVFSGTSPMQQKGAVLVPLRGVFEALGAQVNYNPASKTIVAQKGSTTVELTVGSATATVDGQSQPLSQPAESIGGSTLVPLRFVAEALGAYVQWVPTTLTVQIQTPEAHLSTLPPPPLPKDPSRPHNEVIGQLTGIYTNASPEEITVRVNGQNSAITLSSGSVVQVKRNDQPAVAADIHTLGVGDQVRVKLASDGTAAVIEAVYGEVIGTVKSIQQQADGTYVVSLNDGSSVQMSLGADLTMAGRRILYKDIMAAERVRIRTDQSNKVGYSLDVVTDERPGNIGDPAPTDQSSLEPLIGPMQNVGPASEKTGAAFPASVVSSEYPVDGSTIASSRPVIYALLADHAGGDITQSSFRLKVDGSDVTSNATVTSNFVTYQPVSPLGEGQHTVELSAENSSGNCVTRSWSFTSGKPHEPLSFTSSRFGRQIVLKPGESVDLTLSAQPGGTAFATFGSMRVALSETRPGLYTGKIKPEPGSSLICAPVTAHYSAPDHSCVIANLQQMITIASSSPARPQIKSPTEGQQISSNIQIDGVSAPGSIVDVTVNYSAKALGIIAITGTAASTQVIADTAGQWKTDKIALSTPSLLSSSHDTGLTITATSVDAAGQHSLSSSVKVLLQ
jgi:hypothetical protein